MGVVFLKKKTLANEKIKMAAISKIAAIATHLTAIFSANEQNDEEKL